ncbi:MAG: radical SAM protein [Deltaproteobacteria bacterium]|nr:radical SAM protein [Deltaproteobacteria bacterium]
MVTQATSDISGSATDRQVTAMKVCLVRGALVSPQGSVNNEPTPPIGLAYLAGSLKAAGFELQGVDATGQALDRVERIPGSELQANGISIQEVVEQIDPATKVVGVSAMFSHEWTYHRALMLAIKQRLPEVVLIAGGEHCTALSEYCLRDCPAIDYIATGEGEETMTEFCRTVAGGGDPSRVAGLVYLRNGELNRSAPRGRIRNVDEIPWPDWELFPIDPYLAENISFGASFGRNMPIMASRGCPYQCTFCSNAAMWTTRYSIRSPENVLAEIEKYRRKYDITGLQFYDLTAIIKKDWIVAFCGLMAERGIRLDWSLPSGTRSEALDDEALSWIARAGCKYLVYAPESGSAETLKLIKKKIKLDRMEQSIRSAIRQGIVIRANLIIGFPHETRGQILRTLWQMIKLAWLGVDEAPLYPFQPYPGTELFAGLLQRGKVRLSDEYFETLATFSTGSLSPPRRSFCDRVGRLELYLYRMLGLLVFTALSYLLRPQRIWRTIYNLAFTDRSATVMEQRMRDKLRHVRAALSFRRTLPAAEK